MVPKENKKPKEVSSVNQRPNPSTGQKRRAGPPVGDRDPKQMKPLSPEELKAQKALEAQQAIINAEKELRNFLNLARGKDQPGGIVKQWLRQRPVRLMVQQLQAEGEPNPKPYVLTGFKGKYSIHSNAPGFRLRDQDNIFHIRSENILRTMGEIIFAENTYPATFTDPRNLEKAFAAQHWTAGLAEQDAASLVQWGSVEGDDERSEEEKLGGLECLSFKTQGDFWLDFKNKDESMSKELKDLIKDLNKGSHVITVVWKKRDVKKSVQRYWLHRMEKAVLEGVWSYYKDHIGKLQGQMFFAWQNAPDKEIKHQLWMEITSLKKSKHEVKKFASQALKRSFGSMRELEIVESIALIYETMYENQNIRMYFGNDKYHEARVLDNINGYVQLEVKVARQDDYTMPPVIEDSRFQVQKIQLNDPDLVMTEDDKEEPIVEGLFSAPLKQESAPQATPTYSHSGTDYSARAINVNHDGDFAVSFFINEKKERAAFVKGEQITVALKMVRNPIPTQRQLKAIGKVCKAPGKKDPWRHTALQRYLKGAGDPNTDEETLGSVKEEAFKRMTDREKELFEAYVANCNMNTSQEEVWKHIFNYRHFLTQLRGSPGTGKTRTVATIALSFALLKVKTAVCAPSNTATKECMKNVIQQLNLLYLIDPTARDDFLVVFLPTTASTKSSLANLAEEQAANDFVAEGQGSANDPCKEYRLHAHIIRSIQTRVNTGQGDVETARKWLDVLAKLQRRATVSRKELRNFVDLGIAESERILKDQEVRIVVSTSNNSALMAEYGYKVGALVIDEAASATEQDSMVPLSLGARYNAIVGDHEQLKPFVRSRGYNEFACQLELSLYERFYGHCNVPVFHLKVNYRMQPDIAELPNLVCK